MCRQSKYKDVFLFYFKAHVFQDTSLGREWQYTHKRQISYRALFVSMPLSLHFGDLWFLSDMKKPLAAHSLRQGNNSLITANFSRVFDLYESRIDKATSWFCWTKIESSKDRWKRKFSAAIEVGQHLSKSAEVKDVYIANTKVPASAILDTSGTTQIRTSDTTLPNLLFLVRQRNVLRNGI